MYHYWAIISPLLPHRNGLELVYYIFWFYLTFKRCLTAFISPVHKYCPALLCSPYLFFTVAINEIVSHVNYCSQLLFPPHIYIHTNPYLRDQHLQTEWLQQFIFPTKPAFLLSCGISAPMKISFPHNLMYSVCTSLPAHSVLKLQVCTLAVWTLFCLPLTNHIESRSFDS